MLSSTQEYLCALRDGDYLAFLEWPQFVMTHYQLNEHGLAADDLVNLLIFEAINHGFSEEDIRWVAVLYSLRESNPGLMRGALDYALTSITIVSLQCIMYWRMGVHHHLLSSTAQSSKDIGQLISLCNEQLPEPPHQLVAQDEKTFSQWVTQASTEQLDKAYSQINAITNLRNAANNYISLLEIEQNGHNVLHPSRLSVLKRLAHYLNSNSQLTNEVEQQIISYVAKIWDLKPETWEEDYLNVLAPPSLEQTFWHKLTTIGITFFNLLQPEATQEEPAPKNRA